MKLREARLCLDCEELHCDERCPMCASEAFMFVTKWIPPANNDRAPKPTLPAVDEVGLGATFSRLFERR